MKIVISKLDAARRQLDTAIRLFFYDSDPVSIHTLASASLNVLIDLSRAAEEDKKSIRDEMLERVFEDKRKWFVNKLRETENFLKHANRDPDDKHSFNPESSLLQLIDAVSTYGKITGEKTVLMEAFSLWFMLKYPTVFIFPEECKDILTSGSNLMEGIPKSTFLETMVPFLMRRGVGSN